MIVIETGMYNLKFRVNNRLKSFFRSSKWFFKDKKYIYYLSIWEQNEIWCRVIVLAAQKISTANWNTLQTKNVITTVNKMINDLFSCLFREILKISKFCLYWNCVGLVDLADLVSSPNVYPQTLFWLSSTPSFIGLCKVPQYFTIYDAQCNKW